MPEIHTEDDTFNRLRRPTKSDMVTIYWNWFIEGGVEEGEETTNEFLAAYGWTWDELREEVYRHYAP